MANQLMGLDPIISLTDAHMKASGLIERSNESMQCASERTEKKGAPIMSLNTVAYRHPKSPDCLSASAHTYENGEKLVLLTDVERSIESLAIQNQDLLAAVEAVLKADYVSTLTGGGSFMRHVPPTILKLREAFIKYRNTSAEYENSQCTPQLNEGPRG